MPLYEYQCESCGRRFEKIQKFSDPLVDTCPTCGGPVHKLVSSPAFHLKGTGWYATDYPHQGKGQSPDGDKSDPASASTAGDADKSSKTSKDSKESKDSRDSSDSKGSKDSRDSKDAKASSNSKDSSGAKESGAGPSKDSTPPATSKS
jgi:putative FmdB family regulatory protein